MRKLGTWVRQFWEEDEGPTAVEYAFLAFLVFVVCVAAVVSLGNSTNSVYQNNVNKIESAS